MNVGQAQGHGLKSHPRGLAVLASTELAERFSYYGMTALLALYLNKQLLLPGHAEHVLGLGALRRLFEFRGAMPDQAFASLIYGWYAGLVYFTPLIGGWIADRWLGAKRTVTLGALLMAGGHLAMSFDRTFLIALLLLIAGSGCLKGNIAAQVGTLYPPDDESRRARGFTIFSTGINIGAVAGPLATGAVAQNVGWHAGFALAAGLMLVALCIYLAGQRELPEAKPRDRAASPNAALTADERRRVSALIAIILFNVPIATCYYMIGNIGIVWVDQSVALGTPLGPVPAAWFNSMDSFASILVVPPLIMLWRVQAARGAEPNSVGKIVIGAFINAAAALCFVAGIIAGGPGGHVNVLWAIAGYFAFGLAFMYYWPITLGLVASAAPAKVRATMMGSAYLALFFGNVLMGWVGSFYGQMSPASFWLLDCAIGLAAALPVLVARGWLTRVLHLSAT